MENRFEPPQLVVAQVVNISRYVLRVGGSYLTCVPLLFIPKAAEKKSGGVQILSVVLNVINPLLSEF